MYIYTQYCQLKLLNILKM